MVRRVLDEHHVQDALSDDPLPRQLVELGARQLIAADAVEVLAQFVEEVPGGGYVVGLQVDPSGHEARHGIIGRGLQDLLVDVHGQLVVLQRQQLISQSDAQIDRVRLELGHRPDHAVGTVSLPREVVAQHHVSGPAQLLREAAVQALEVREGLLGPLHVEQDGRQQELVRLDQRIQLAQVAVEDLVRILEVADPGVAAAQQCRGLEIIGLDPEDVIQVASRAEVLPAHDQDVGQATKQGGVRGTHEEGFVVVLLGQTEPSLPHEEPGVLNAHLDILGAHEQVGVEELQGLGRIPQLQGIPRRAEQEILLGGPPQAVLRWAAQTFQGRPAGVLNLEPGRLPRGDPGRVQERRDHDPNGRGVPPPLTGGPGELRTVLARGQGRESHDYKGSQLSREAGGLAGMGHIQGSVLVSAARSGQWGRHGRRAARGDIPYGVENGYRRPRAQAEIHPGSFFELQLGTGPELDASSYGGPCTPGPCSRGDPEPDPPDCGPPAHFLDLNFPRLHLRAARGPRIPELPPPASQPQ